MSYLIKTVGVDLAPTRSGLAAIEMKADSWGTTIVDAGAMYIRPVGRFSNQFNSHLSAAARVLEFVKKHRPDLIGIEDFTNQVNSHISFSIAHLGGIVRHVLWEAGYRQLLIVPGKVTKFVAASNARLGDNLNKGLLRNRHKDAMERKKQVVRWVQEKLGQQLVGNAKQVSDMSDAVVYGVIAAVFFSGHWLQKMPPLSSRQREVFHCKVPNPGSKVGKALAEGEWSLNGLLDLPPRYLIRNLELENEVYTPEWMRELPREVLYLGD